MEKQMHRPSCNDNMLKSAIG